MQYVEGLGKGTPEGMIYRASPSTYTSNYAAILRLVRVSKDSSGVIKINKYMGNKYI